MIPEDATYYTPFVVGGRERQCGWKVRFVEIRVIEGEVWGMEDGAVFVVFQFVVRSGFALVEFG